MPKILMDQHKNHNPENRALLNKVSKDALLHSILHNMRGVVYRCAIDEFYTMSFISHEIERMTGYSARGFVDNSQYSFISLIHPDDLPTVNKAINKGLANKEPYEAQYRLYCTDGAYIWVSEKGHPVYDEQGVPQWLDGIIIDIHEQKSAQLELQTKSEKLQSSEARLKQTIEELKALQSKLTATAAHNNAITAALDESTIVSISDIRGRITKVNQAFCKNSGYPEQELLGQDHRILNSGHHPRSFWVNMWKTIAQGKTWRAEVCNQTKTGKLYWVDTVINPMYDTQGKIYQYLSIRSLVTERKHAEQALKAKTQDLSASEEELKQNLEQLQNTQDLLKNKLRLIENQRNEIISSINYAQRIQEAILPKEQDLRQYFDSFVFFRPRNIVSGDFFFLAEEGDKVVIAAVDCTGHGVPGAFMSLICNDMLERIVKEKQILKADEILNALHKDVRIALKQSETDNRDGMDVTLLVIDKKSQVAEVSCAKNSLLYFQSNTPFVYKGNRVCIGGMQKEADRVFSKTQIDLKETTALYLLSDGFQDQFGGPENKKFGIKRLRALLHSIHQKHVEEQKDILQKRFDEWKQAQEEKQIDDVMIVGIRL